MSPFRPAGDRGNGCTSLQLGAEELSVAHGLDLGFWKQGGRVKGTSMFWGT